MKLTCKVLKSVPGVAYGHSTLEAMQNWRMPKIDLFVREVIQNCSDAADGVDGTDYFCVEFNAKEFNGKSFISMLNGFDESIIERFSDEHSKYLEIRDTGTTGLTGPLVISQENEMDHGNYYRLVFDTGKAQTRKYSGGNWGYGKSAYYGMGAGFVIYYSRIHENNEYKSRLIVSLIENEESEKAILRGHENGSKSAGKAWWGKEIQGQGADEVILPLQDDSEIKEVLDIFHIKPFDEKQTGTAVIIPYVDYSELMSNMISEEMNVAADIRNRCEWTYPDNDGFIEHLKLSIQRWYAPAINNVDLPRLSGKKWLYVTVNEDPISADSMYPFFQMVQRLYTAALAKTKKAKEDTSRWSPYYSDTIFPVRVNNYIDNSSGGNTDVGYLAVARIPKKMVDCEEGENLDPFLLLGYYEESGKNWPLVMFARRLGMVIDYAYRNEWAYGVPVPDGNDEYVFAFFVPFLGESKKLKPSLSVKKYAGKTLEEYLISCEASDHDGWEDHDKMTLVSSIQGRVTDKLKTLLKGNITPATGSNADRLGTALSRMLGISRTKLGKKKSSSGTGKGSGTSTKKLRFSSEIREYGGTSQTIHFTLDCKKGLQKAIIDLVIYSDGRNMKSVDWEKEIGTAFPVSFSQVTVSCVPEGENDARESVVLNESNATGVIRGMSVSLRQETKRFKNGDVLTSRKTTRFVVSANNPNNVDVHYDGVFVVHSEKREFEYDIVASEEER